MRKSKREKMIKEIIDEQFGPEITVDEIYAGIDFSTRDVKYVKWYKKPLVIRLCNVFILILCIVVTFVVTNSVGSNYYYKTKDLLDKEEISYLDDNDYKYLNNVDATIIIDNENYLCIFKTEKDDMYVYFIKVLLENLNNNEVLINSNNQYFIFNVENDFQEIFTTTKDNNVLEFSVTFNGKTNKYMIENN